MSLQTVLRLVAETLQAADIPYMLTGSLAAAYHGAPRATQDIDVVVDAPRNALLDLANRLEAAGYYFSRPAIEEAIQAGGMFNAVDPESGWKVDFILRKDRPFSRSEFDARTAITFSGIELTVARPEDVIVAKLEWSQMSGSERQLRDVAEILTIQGSALDTAAIEKWAAELGVLSEWDRAKSIRDSELTWDQV